MIIRADTATILSRVYFLCHLIIQGSESPAEKKMLRRNGYFILQFAFVLTHMHVVYVLFYD